MSSLNPEFSIPGFIPDPEKRYQFAKTISCSGFNRLQSLVIGGPEKISKIREFLRQDPDEFKRQSLHRNRHGVTALMIACINSRWDSSNEIVEILIPFSDANARDILGWTALMFASMLSRRSSTDETVRLLIPHSNVNIKNKRGKTSFVFIKKCSHDSIECCLRRSNPLISNIGGDALSHFLKSIIGKYRSAFVFKNYFAIN